MKHTRSCASSPPSLRSRNVRFREKYPDSLARRIRAQPLHCVSMEPVSRRISELGQLFQPVQAFFDRSQRARERSGEEACDFRAGDPQELAMPAYVEALRAGA